MTIEVVGPDQLDRAVAELVAGGLVAIPTETVYGLAADAASAAAVARIFAAKGRPADHPLIVHVHQQSVAETVAEMNDVARLLADAFWPGPLTMVLNRRTEGADGSLVASETVGGRPTVGVRVPDHPVTLELLTRFAEVGSGLVAAPSANRFGSISPTTADHVVDDGLPGLAMVVDGGPCRVGVESTIVDLTGPQPELLRPGGISTVELEAVVGPVADGRGGESRAPGMLVSHYAPSTPVHLCDGEGEAELAALLASHDKVAVIAPFVVDHEPSWAMSADARQYAASLYGVLRAADLSGADRIVVVPPRKGELLDAVVDRLTKAAADAHVRD